MSIKTLIAFWIGCALLFAPIEMDVKVPLLFFVTWVMQLFSVGKGGRNG